MLIAQLRAPPPASMMDAGVGDLAAGMLGEYNPHPLRDGVRGQAAIATPLRPAAAMSAAPLVISGRPRRNASSRYAAS
jgi:hypothetical protein